jgi:hypothetical protein
LKRFFVEFVRDFGLSHKRRKPLGASKGFPYFHAGCVAISYFEGDGAGAASAGGGVAAFSGGVTLRAVPAVAELSGLDTEIDAEPAGFRSGLDPTIAPPSGPLAEIEACGEMADEPSELQPANSRGNDAMTSVRRIMGLLFAP